MSDYENPYQAPETQIVPEAKQNSGVELTETMLQNLNGASPWLRFIGILGYISVGLSALGIIFALIAMIAVGSSSLFPPEFDAFIPIYIVMFAFSVPLVVLMFFPVHFIFKFGQKIRDFKFSNSTDDLEQAFKNNKSLWKFVGILCIISLAAFPVMIIVSIIVGVTAALGAF